MRIGLTALSVGVLLALLAAPASAAGFEPGVKIVADGKPIDVTVGHLVPCVVDWNDDGKKDLLVGQFSGGKIRLYLNTAKDEAPEFRKFAYLKAGGVEISLPAG